MKEIIRNLYLIPIFIYQKLISPYLGRGKCRYTPSCSTYFITAVKRFGIIKGSIMGWARVFRCHNLFMGGPDEVPPTWSWKAIKDGYIIYRKHRSKDDQQ